MHKTLAHFFVLPLILIFSFNGCQSEDDFMTSINTSDLYFESSKRAESNLLCQFDLQTVYFHTQPLHLILKASLKNDTGEPIQLDASKDNLELIISERVKYAAPLDDQSDYNQLLKNKGTYDTTITLTTQSLIQYAKNIKIKEIVFSVNDNSMSCSAQLSRKLVKVE